MVDVAAALKAHLYSMAAPVLFVGAGLSRRYTGADSWESLLRKLASKTPSSYEYFLASANGSFPLTATKIAEVFHEIWWNSGDYETSKRDWASKINSTEGAFKVEAANLLRGAAGHLPEDGPLAQELQLLKNSVIDGIITTNFDDILETLFPDFKVFVGQDDLLFSTVQGVGEIYKIHGSVNRPESLVITSADYHRFASRDAYLAAKLLTIFVEHPVIFLGYSLTDDNVQEILRSIVNCLQQDNIDELTDRLIFIQWSPDEEPGFGPYTMMIEKLPLTVTRIVVQDFMAVFSVLCEMKRTFPAQILRRLKEQVYELVLSGDTNGQLFVANIDDDTQATEIDVVFGVGMQAKLSNQGYTGLNRWDLVNDILSDGTSLDATRIVTDVLPQLLRQPGNLPVYKYLRQSGNLTDDGKLIDSRRLPPRLSKMASKIERGFPASYVTAKAKGVLSTAESIQDLEEELGREGVLNVIGMLEPSKISVPDLKQFLLDNVGMRETSVWNVTQYMKAVCLYDWHRYAKAEPPEAPILTDANQS